MLNRLLRPSLMRQIVMLILMMLVTLSITYVVTDRIAKQIIERQVTDSVSKILLQVEEKMISFNADMQGISTFLFYSPTVQSYVNATDALNRILMNRELVSMFANTISMKENIRGLELYDAEGKLMTRIGEGEGEFVAAPVKELTYSGLLSLDNRPTERFYAITVPVYGLNSSQLATDYRGTGRYVMDVTNFSPILKSAKITAHSRVILIDQDNKTIASEGIDADQDTIDLEQWRTDDAYIVQTITLPHSGWRLISVIPKGELLSDLDTVQQINIVTYGIMFIILSLFLSIFFTRILKPIKSLMDFITSYPKKGEETRFTVVHKNEIGVLGSKLNRMLDDISALSSEVQSTQARMYGIELAKKQMEVSAFRNQINPHFLYNTLESIRAVAFYYDVREIAEITESLSNMFRYAVKGSNVVTIADEIAHVREYARIIDFRFRGRFRIEIEVQEELKEVAMLKMLLQPLVENAVFHGLERKIGQGHVLIRILQTKDKQIMLTVEDNGYGMSEEKLEGIRSKLERYDEPGYMDIDNGKGIGMVNIYRRIKLFYGDQAELTVRSVLHEGTSVAVSYPIVNLADDEG